MFSVYLTVAASVSVVQGVRTCPHWAKEFHFITCPGDCLGEQAHNTCSSKGAGWGLAVIRSPGDFEKYKGLKWGPRAWISSPPLDLCTRQSLRWWDDGEPNNAGGPETCIEALGHKGGRMNDLGCWRRLSHCLCEKCDVGYWTDSQSVICSNKPNCNPGTYSTMHTAGGCQGCGPGTK